jgi:putative ABC transport system permease protein
MSLTLPPQNAPAFVGQVLEQVAHVPGVEAVAAMSWPTPGGLNFPFNLAEHPLPAGDQMVSYSAISPGYFRALSVRLRAGREFTGADRIGTSNVAIVNETLARLYFDGGDPVGQTLVLSYMGERQTRQIVGIASDLKQEDPARPARPEVLVPFDQQPWRAAWLLVRPADVDPLRFRNEVQRAIWAVDKDAPASTAATLDQALDQRLSEPRLYSTLLGVFAAVAVALAAIGVYGLMSYSVAQRTHEIGIRLALGAQGRDVLRVVVGEGMTLVLAGLSLGLLAALGATRLLQGLLYGVSASDPATFAGLSVFLGAVALLACYLPARRATLVDPLLALRQE